MSRFELLLLVLTLMDWARRQEPCAARRLLRSLLQSTQAGKSLVSSSALMLAACEFGRLEATAMLRVGAVPIISAT